MVDDDGATDRDPVLDAHRGEILEGLIADPTINSGDWQALNKRWGEIQPNKDDGVYRVVFGDGKGPRRVETTAYCHHCHTQVSSSGVSFVEPEEDLVEQELLLFSHTLFKFCRNWQKCRCWVVDKRNIDGRLKHPTWVRCVMCNLATHNCNCDDGPTAGPCILTDRYKDRL